MEVSTICGSFIYGEGQEELVNRGRYKTKKEKKKKKTRKESQKKCYIYSLEKEKQESKKESKKNVMFLFYGRTKRTP